MFDVEGLAPEFLSRCFRGLILAGAVGVVVAIKIVQEIAVFFGAVYFIFFN